MSVSPPHDADRTIRLLAAISTLSTIGFMAFNAVIGLIGRELGYTDTMVGALLTAAGLGWMAISRFWGRRSDRLGRLRVLREGLVGNVAAFTAIALFVVVALAIKPAIGLSFGILLVLRICMTLTYAALQPTSQAFVADVTTPATRGAAFALLGAGGAFGMILGPAMASLLAPVSLAAPLIGACLFSICGLALSSRLLPHAPPIRVGPQTVLKFTDPRLRLPLFTAFSAMTCVLSSQVVTGFFAQDRFGMTREAAAAQAGLALTAVGIALVVAQTLGRGTGWPPAKMILFGAPIGAVGFLFPLIVTSPPQMLIGYFVSGFGMGFVFPGFYAAASLAVRAQEQGAAAGTVAVAQAAGMVVAPIVATWLYVNVGPSAPFVFGAMLLLAVAANTLQYILTPAMAEPAE